jgi:hypothetical protein
MRIESWGVGWTTVVSNSKNKAGIVAHSWNPSDSEGRDQEGLWFEASPGKVSRTPSQSISQTWHCISMIPVLWEAVHRRILV